MNTIKEDFEYYGQPLATSSFVQENTKSSQVTMQAYQDTSMDWDMETRFHGLVKRRISFWEGQNEKKDDDGDVCKINIPLKRKINWTESGICRDRSSVSSGLGSSKGSVLSAGSIRSIKESVPSAGSISSSKESVSSAVSSSNTKDSMSSAGSISSSKESLSSAGSSSGSKDSVSCTGSSSGICSETGYEATTTDSEEQNVLKNDESNEENSKAHQNTLAEDVILETEEEQNRETEESESIISSEESTNDHYFSVNPSSSFAHSLRNFRENAVGSVIELLVTYFLGRSIVLFIWSAFTSD
ncbi:uncharacterized protein LOC123672930 [Harmonia axyridis]|uniref:uncharacterized protein LOC123672930 n=1 Tax=Harmonia axyridis TaxID=115357 RepID=UPI001E274EE8|nr:uncharacterized protein LOC123672930 [Harmonia axyridis]